MNLRVGQRVLCCLNGGDELTEHAVTDFFSPEVINGAVESRVLLSGGHAVSRSEIFAVFTA
jgi:hypothetical protein